MPRAEINRPIAMRKEAFWKRASERKTKERNGEKPHMKYDTK